MISQDRQSLDAGFLAHHCNDHITASGGADAGWIRPAWVETQPSISVSKHAKHVGQGSPVWSCTRFDCCRSSNALHYIPDQCRCQICGRPGNNPCADRGISQLGFVVFNQLGRRVRAKNCCPLSALITHCSSSQVAFIHGWYREEDVALSRRRYFLLVSSRSWLPISLVQECHVYSHASHSAREPAAARPPPLVPMFC